eukprot:scaffold52402_cov26-Tisochrysis_lutea.AAC.2
MVITGSTKAVKAPPTTPPLFVRNNANSSCECEILARLCYLAATGQADRSAVRREGSAVASPIDGESTT